MTYKEAIASMGRLMTFKRFAFVAVLGAALGGCADADLGRILKNSVAGTAESACRAASNCSAGMRRDALAPKPAWDRGGAPPKDSPYRLPPPK